jgi:hypothetical protein
MGTRYDIFARKQHPEPLLYIGSIEAEKPEDVPAMSLQQFGPESDWLEMVAVPQQQIIVVFSAPEEQPA